MKIDRPLEKNMKFHLEQGKNLLYMPRKEKQPLMLKNIIVIVFLVFYNAVEVPKYLKEIMCT
jgi:hypothetical protein